MVRDSPVPMRHTFYRQPAVPGYPAIGMVFERRLLQIIYSNLRVAM